MLHQKLNQPTLAPQCGWPRLPKFHGTISSRRTIKVLSGLTVTVLFYLTVTALYCYTAYYTYQATNYTSTILKTSANCTQKPLATQNTVMHRASKPLLAHSAKVLLTA